MHLENAKRNSDVAHVAIPSRLATPPTRKCRAHCGQAHHCAGFEVAPATSPPAAARPRYLEKSSLAACISHLINNGRIVALPLRLVGENLCRSENRNTLPFPLLRAFLFR